jgi:hypothetical protein
MVAAGTSNAWAGPQAPAFPPVEVSVQVAGLARGDGESGVAPGVKVSWNLDRRTAIDFAADFQPRQSSGPYSSQTQRLFLVELRQSLIESGDTKVFGLIGGGAGSRDRTYAPYTSGPYTSPGFTYREDIRAFEAGAGIERRLAPYLALRADASFILSNISADLRAGIGVSVPIRPFPKAPAQATVFPAGFYSVHTGQKVWVTTSDGQVRMGEVAALSANTITLRHRDGQTQLAAADVRRIDGVDSIKDGAWIGAGVGAGVALVTGVLAYAVDGGDGGEAFAFGLAWGGIGFGMGAMAGAVIDGCHEGRRVLYDGRKSTISLAPIVTNKGAGVGATIRWR